MKAVIAQVPADLLESRRRTGTDRWDEIWEGVLHMPPMPNRDHQDLEWQLETWLRTHWAQPQGNRVYHQINLAAPGGWPDKNYRIPDLVLLTPDRFHIDRNEYFEGAPSVAVEIRSPGDEAYEKLPFYADLGVPEVWMIDRDTRVPEVHELAADGYQKLPPTSEGWIESRATGIELKAVDNRKIALRMDGDAATRRDLPKG
jgi:Uma2 family endonuclease